MLIVACVIIILISLLLFALMNKQGGLTTYTSPTTTTGLSDGSYKVVVTLAHNFVNEGGSQTITVNVTRGNQPISGISINAYVKSSVSGTIHFATITQTNGIASIDFTIDSRFSSGNYTVTIPFEGQNYTSSFQVL
jgi:phosphatidate phosphatase APP1